MDKHEQGSFFPELPAPAKYPNAPADGKQDTSRAAAAKITKTAKPLRERVAAFIRRRDGKNGRPLGATCWEVEQSLKLSHQTASARVTELNKTGAIIKSGEKRETASGCAAHAWIIAPKETT